MKERLKYNKFIAISLLLACVGLLLGLIMYVQSGQVKVVNLKVTENAGIEYKVHLNDSTYYNRDYLEEGMQYISSLIDKIEINYKYNSSYSDKIDINYDNKVTADIKIVDVTNKEKIIYEKEEDLRAVKESKKNTSSISVNQNVVIDYAKYNSFASDFKAKNGITADCKLIVTFVTTQSNATGFSDKLEKINTKTIEIPLSEKMIVISKSEDTNNEKSLYALSTSTSYSNVLKFVISIALFAISVILLITGIYYILKRNKVTSEYEKYIYKLLKDYDSYITESTNIIELKSDVIIVKDFKELLDVRNNVEKAIVYNRISDKETRFVVVDGEQEYCYILKEEDFN